MSNEDVLELNADGEFVVPELPVPIAKGNPSNSSSIPVSKEDSSQTFRKSLDDRGDSSRLQQGVSSASDVLSSIAPGEYKVFSYEGKVDVIIHLESSQETVRSVNVSREKIVSVETNTGKRLSIDLGSFKTGMPVALVAQNASACNFEDFVVITFR
jgi:hypothetical protein